MKKKAFIIGMEGSVITIAVVSAAILSILVAGILAYFSNEYMFNVRSHRWTQALHLAEGAVEYGFGQFTYQGNQFQSAPTGWSGGSGVYTKTISNLTDTAGRIIGNCTVTVSGLGTANPQILGVGTVTQVPYRGPVVSRAVRVILGRSAMFPAGVVSKNQINLNGNNAYSDSYDSTDVTKSTGGQYDPAKRQPHGDIASNAQIVNTIGIGNADIYGLVSTGPGGTVSMGANGSVGPTFVPGDRADTIAEGEANGWIRHDFAVDIPEVSLPSGAGSWASLGAINNNTLINGGDWIVSSMNLAGSKTLTIQGTVRLYITGEISITGNGQITLSNGAALEAYAADKVKIEGNGILNVPGLPIRNQWRALSTNSFSVAGNGSWIGTVYAPQSPLTIGGNGNVSGAVVANSVTLSGNAQFHYDESLKTSSAYGGYLVSSWQEMRYIGGVWQ